MRIIDSIPHAQMKISIFSMNDKYMVKFEAGPYEQTYKITHEDAGSLEALKSRVDENLCSEVIDIFRKMHKSWQESDS
jgi:hypothetical protein